MEETLNLERTDLDTFFAANLTVAAPLYGLRILSLLSPSIAEYVPRSSIGVVALSVIGAFVVADAPQRSRNILASSCGLIEVKVNELLVSRKPNFYSYHVHKKVRGYLDDIYMHNVGWGLAGVALGIGRDLHPSPPHYLRTMLGLPLFWGVIAAAGQHYQNRHQVAKIRELTTPPEYSYRSRLL